MLSLLSPAKTMKFDFGADKIHSQQPKFVREAKELVSYLKQYSKPELMELMSISDKLADLNTERFQVFKGNDKAKVSAPAIFAYRGDVYIGLDAMSLEKEELKIADQHLRILTGLYGILRPGDIIEPYRLEMGTDLSTKKYNNLYEFWGGKITKTLLQDMKDTKAKYLINLASNEYSKAINQKSFGEKWVDVDFREMRKGKLRFVSFNAKKARGMMARYIIKNRCKDIEELRGFNAGGYLFDRDSSDTNQLLFIKPE